MNISSKKSIAAISIATVLLSRIFSIAGSTAYAANDHRGEKVTICHAAGRETTTHFVTLTIAWNAVFGQAGHFYENGTPRAGHEHDYLGECENNEEPEPIPGCTDPDALNFDPEATYENDTCEYEDVEPTPTPTPEPGVEVDAWKENYDCSDKDFAVSYRVTNNGVGVKDILVSFKYRNDTKEARTNDNGEAKVGYSHQGSGQVVITANGYESKDMYIEDLNCGGGTSDPEPKVLGASSEGQVLGAYAEAGVAEDILMQVAGVFGYFLTGTGMIMRMRKKK